MGAHCAGEYPFVRVFAHGSATAGVRSTFAYEGMGLTAE
jgi:hypothetical protein